MEAFGLFKFWRNSGNEATVADVGIRNQALETDDETDVEDSFIDFVFTPPDFDGGVEINSRSSDVVFKRTDNEVKQCKKSGEKDGDSRFDFVDSPKDVFYKGRVFPIEQSSKPQSPISLLRSPPRFRLFMLWFKKSSKSEKVEAKSASMETPEHQCQKSSQTVESKRFSVSKVDELQVVPSFTRDNSLRSKLQRESFEDVSSCNSSRRFQKDGVQKYLKMMKPLYEKASKRYSDILKFPDQSPTVTPLASPATVPACSPRKQTDRQRSFPAGLRGVRKQIGKSRSAPSSFGVMSPANRRDDSLLQHNDGIQGAILHCKRSYSSSTTVCSVLSRSASDASYEKSIVSPRNSSSDPKRSSI